MFKVSFNCHKQATLLPRANTGGTVVFFVILAKPIEAKQPVNQRGVFSVRSRRQLCIFYTCNFVYLEKCCSCYAAWMQRPVWLPLHFSPSLWPDSTSFLTSHGFLLRALSRQKTWHCTGYATWNGLLHSINGNLLLFAFYKKKKWKIIHTDHSIIFYRCSDSSSRFSREILKKNLS